MKIVKNSNKIKITKFMSKIFHILFFLYQIKSEITECPRESPILISNECKLE